MCGICGQVVKGEGQAEASRALLESMCECMRYRGPDDEGVFMDGAVGLGHRRLSIIDVEGGKQPLSNEDGTIWIVFNGEIYNFKELRAELLAKGHRFSTNTDTEAIVHLYEDEGEACVGRLRGMFAFAIWDRSAGRVFLARDRLGQKPLFYADTPRAFFFASEAKALLQCEGVDTSLDTLSMHHYLSLRFIPQPATMFRGVKKLPPGHTLLYEKGRFRIKRYWDLAFFPKSDLGERDLVRKLEEILLETVDLHLVSDVPLGAFLSGGIDSSLIVAMMSKVSPRRVKTFSIGTLEEDYNELPWAKMVAERYGTEHREFIVKPDIVNIIPKLIWFMDEPTDPFAISVYYVARETRKYVTVALGGDGGDESFGGYDRYFGNRFVDHYRKIPSGLRNVLVGPLVGRIPESYKRKSFAQKVRWLETMAAENGGRRYALSMSYFRFTPDMKDRLYTEKMKEEVSGTDPADALLLFYDSERARSPVDRMMCTDTMTRLPEYTLLILDRMTMASSLEGRSPYLDHPVIEFMAKVPWEMKLKGKTLKYLARELAKEYLPEPLLTRDKQGFGFPLPRWLRKELAPMTREFFSASRLAQEGYFRGEVMRDLLEEHISGKADHHARIWTLLNLEIWFRLFQDRRCLEPVEEIQAIL
jgi:asparagine synthase (glutamine-hydrolysing)